MTVYLDTSVIVRVLLRQPDPTIDRFLTHDQQLGQAARALAFTVEGID